ncbi:MAG: hypothetical protein HY763_04510 [Planctomycetes bacterium]|nr:hypothetical protein [Planctomycetota bacterium]
MPPRVHRAAFVPPPIGLAYVAVDNQGRLVIPVGLQRSLAPRKPPFDVSYTLAGRGYATVQPSDTWPPGSEREEVGRILTLLQHADPSKLSAAQLRIVQDFARIVACRYLDGQIHKKWQVPIPEPVRAWLGLVTQGSNWMGHQSRQRHGGRGRARTGQHVIVIGTIGALEIWSEEPLKEVLPTQLPEFARLRSEAAELLRHSGR